MNKQWHSNMMKRRKWFYTLMALMLLIVGAAACWYLQPENSTAGTPEEKEYDQLQRSGKWQQIIDMDKQNPTQSLACHKVVLLAKYRLGLASAMVVYECLADSREVLTSPTAALMMSDVYMQLGMTNMAQRAAFEAMVSESDVKKNERSLRRLTETALITGHYELALKYIAIVEENFNSSKWVQTMKPLAEHPELIKAHPVFNKLRQNYEKSEDQFFL